MEMKKYWVEKKNEFTEGFTYVGEFNTTREVADAMDASPAKTKNALDNMPKDKWNRLGNYRIGVRS